MKVSKLYGQPVFDKNKKTRGYILGITRAGETLKYLVCCDLNERIFYAEVDRCRLLNEGAVIEAPLKKIENFEGLTELKLGIAAFSEGGKYMGRLADCTAVRGKIVSVKIGKTSYPADLVALGDAVILKGCGLAARNMFISALLGE